jgi:hypothetical protein
MLGMVRRTGPGGWKAGKGSSDRRAGRPAALRVMSGPVLTWAVRRGGLGLCAAAVVLAAQPAVPASSAPAPAWAKQAPATHPAARASASMA